MENIISLTNNLFDYFINHLNAQTFFIVYLIILNVSSLFAMLWDKWMAIKKAQRISEQTLLAMGFFGGGLGGLVGMFLFRHKIRKPYFTIVYLAGIFLVVLVYYQFFASLF